MKNRDEERDYASKTRIKPLAEINLGVGRVLLAI